MESESSQLPLKVCRKCSVASRTDADACPSCGAPYRREPWQWRWWMAIPIVALAFAGGYFGLSKLVFDDSSSAITAQQGAAIEQGVSQSELEDELGDSSQQTQVGTGPQVQTCLFYDIEDQPSQAWEFCFRRDALVSSEAVPLTGD